MLEVKKLYWLYIIELNRGKYYIGLTKQKFPETRIQQHKVGFYSAQWVKKYGYKRTVDIQNLGEITEDEAKRIETRQTLLLMKKYGKQNVRGGELNYSGKYVKIHNYYWRDEDFQKIVAGFVMLVLSTALILQTLL